MLTVPYVTTAEFTEWPTFLDLLNLRSGDSQLSHQTALLNKILLASSEWCDNYCEFGPGGTLAAHRNVENVRLRPDRRGRLLHHAAHIPVVSVESVAYGTTLGSLTTYTAPPTWIEDGRQLVVDLQGATTAWRGALQFGGPPPNAELYTTWAYTAGFPNTLLSSNITAGSAAVPVLDATGVQPGQTLALYDPGLDESIVVSGTWTPTVGPAVVPLAASVANNHVTTSPVRVTAMGKDIFEACANYAISMLMRPDTQAEDAFPDMRGGISTRLSDSRRDGSGLVFEAQHLLEPYRRTR